MPRKKHDERKNTAMCGVFLLFKKFADYTYFLLTILFPLGYNIAKEIPAKKQSNKHKRFTKTRYACPAPVDDTVKEGTKYPPQGHSADARPGRTTQLSCRTLPLIHAGGTRSEARGHLTHGMAIGYNKSAPTYFQF